MFGEKAPAVALDLLISGEYFGARIAAPLGVEVAKFATQLQAALGHVARINRRVHVRRQIQVVGDGEFKAGGVRAPVTGGQYAGLALFVQRERQVGRPEYRLIQKHDAGVARDPDVAAAVNIQLLGTQEPRIVAGFAGGVIRRFDPVLARPLKQQAFRGAASVAFQERCAAGRPGRRQGHQHVTRRFHIAAVGADFVAQHAAFNQFAALFQADVAFGVEHVILGVMAHPVGGKRLPELAHAHIAKGFKFLVLRALDALRIDEQRYFLGCIGDRQQSRLRLE